MFCNPSVKKSLRKTIVNKLQVSAQAQAAMGQANYDVLTLEHIK